MASLQITDDDIPSLAGKVGIITGGGSGIGLAAVSKWDELRAAFQKCVSESGHIDIAIANAGVSEEYDYFEDREDENGELLEPPFGVIDVNFRSVVNFVKLAVSQMRKQKRAASLTGGSIVITSSATAYTPEQNLPVYSASKFATVGLMRGLRSQLVTDDITINCVAPAATITKLLPANLAGPMAAAGLPVSSAEFVGRALVYSATARQSERVENYGKDTPSTDGPGRWNGRTIMTLAEDYIELEQPHAALKPFWLGWRSMDLTKKQQAATDFRSA
ncbi:short chain dehydrogenase reductase [Ustulina deusta]|nr:short chain dehydrogenase reductase [Ustulina deusta]